MFKKGFTLIELLIVIAVIAILVGIAVPRFMGMREEGNIAKAQAELHALQAGVEAYQIHHLVLPSQQTTSNDSTWQNALTGDLPMIIETALVDPFNTGPALSNRYSYATDNDGVAGQSKYYIIFSVGREGAATITGINSSGVPQGTEGDDKYVTNGSKF